VLTPSSAFCCLAINIYFVVHIEQLQGLVFEFEYFGAPADPIAWQPAPSVATARCELNFPELNPSQTARTKFSLQSHVTLNENVEGEFHFLLLFNVLFLSLVRFPG
jgi:hypothetical protein